MAHSPRYRLSILEPLQVGASLTLTGNAAHYIGTVLRLKPGDRLSLFNRTDGEFSATIDAIAKRDATLRVEAQTRVPDAGTGLTVCFVPIKGGRLETIIEKATELGADVIQPVLSARSVVDKINRERAELIAREAAEQCERVSWPEIREPVKLLNLLGDWPADMPLIYGDETGQSAPIETLLAPPPVGGRLGGGLNEALSLPNIAPTLTLPLKGREFKRWAILAGPEGGFTPDEFAALKKVSAAKGVSLGPRILRADTAIITLTSITLMAWGDWDRPARGTH
jgi:16S rRNA (uracil1498-N3)-methyltransferase